MPSLTRLFVILVALSCASLKEVHASFYLNPHDSFAYQTELGPLIRRAESSASTPPPPNVRTATFFRHRIDQTSNPNFTSSSYNRLVKKDVRICSSSRSTGQTTVFSMTACGIVSIIQNLTVWTSRKSLMIHISGTGYHQHLLLQQHTVALPPPPQEDRPPMPGSPVEYGASSSESEQAVRIVFLLCLRTAESNSRNKGI